MTRAAASTSTSLTRSATQEAVFNRSLREEIDASLGGRFSLWFGMKESTLSDTIEHYRRLRREETDSEIAAIHLDHIQWACAVYEFRYGCKCGF